MYGYQCDYCEGTVQPRQVKREVFKHRDAFVILEDVTIGVCDCCGNRYYATDILHAVHAVATGATPPEKIEQIPVTHWRSAS
jgi:YgiT-type zinc finger domain-containing protein